MTSNGPSFGERYIPPSARTHALEPPRCKPASSRILHRARLYHTRQHAQFLIMHSSPPCTARRHAQLAAMHSPHDVCPVLALMVHLTIHLMVHLMAAPYGCTLCCVIRRITTLKRTKG